MAGLNTTTLQYAVTWEGMPEHEPLVAEITKVLNNDTELKNLKAELEEKQKELKNIQAIQELRTQEINKQLKPLQDQLSDEYAKMNNFNREYWNMAAEKASYINSIGGYAALNRDRGNPNYGEWTKNINQLDQKIYDAQTQVRDRMTKAQNISSEMYKIRMDNITPSTEINNWNTLQREVSNLSMEKITKEAKAGQIARSNLIAQVEEAKTKYNEIMSQENPEYTAVKEKVSSIAK